MPASLRLLALLAVVQVGWVRLSDAPPAAAPRPPAGPWVGAFGDPRFAAAGPVWNVAYSPDGRWLAGVGRGEARLWDAVTGTLVRRLPFGDTAVGSHVHFTPDGRTVLVLAFDDVPYHGPPAYLGPNWPVTVRRFDAATGAELGRVRLIGVHAFRDHGRPAAAFTPDGSGVVVGDATGPPARFDTATGRRVWVADLPLTTRNAYQGLASVAVSPDGSTVAAAVSNTDAPFILLDAATGAVVGRLTEPAADWTTVAFAPDGKHIATTGRGTTVILWDAAASAPAARLTSDQVIGTPLALSPTSRRLAVWAYDAGLRVYDVPTGRETARTSDRLRGLAAVFSPDGETVAAAAGKVFVVEAATGRRRGAVGWSHTAAPLFRFAADGKHVYVHTGPRDDLLTYELPTGREAARAPYTPAAAAARGFLVGNEPTAAGLFGFRERTRLFSADGRLTATQDGGDGNAHPIVVTDTVSGRERSRIPSEHNRLVGPATWFTPTGGELVTAGDYAAAVWDTATGRPVRTLFESEYEVKKLHPFVRVEVSPGGRYLAVFADAERRRRSGCGTCDAFAPDNRPKFVTVWDVATWAAVRTLPVPAGSWFVWQSDDRFTVETVARHPADPRARWTPREEQLLDEQMRLRYDPPPELGPHVVEEWTVAGGRGRAWRFDPSGRERLVPSPDGRLLAGFDPDRGSAGVRLIEAGTGRERHRFDTDEPCRSAAFTPDGRYLLTDHPAAGVRVWDTAGK